MNPERLHHLMQQYIKNDCTKAELDELLTFINEDKNQEWLKHELSHFWHSASPEEGSSDEWDKRFFAMMKGSKAESGLLAQQDRFKRNPFRQIAVAAVSLMIVLTGFYFWYNPDKKNNQQGHIANNEAKPYKNDVPPGGNNATLTLANGSTIVLDSAHNGSLASQGSSKILKRNNGQLMYKAGTGNLSQAMVYNTISTPRGGQYEIILADGSKVWLNAASSLKFPAAFSGKERAVELNGEAYFEIAANKDKPFIVKMKETKIYVLGTNFNVMDYEEGRNIKTTLLEGSVKMKYKDVSAVLKPGQQAIVNGSEKNILVTHGDIDEAIAWKNGFFQFNNSSLETIMQQIARWYDVDVNYAGKPPLRSFTGKMSRNVSLQHVLKVLELSNVKFHLEGRRITVLQ